MRMIISNMKNTILLSNSRYIEEIKPYSLMFVNYDNLRIFSRSSAVINMVFKFGYIWSEKGDEKSGLDILIMLV